MMYLQIIYQRGALQMPERIKQKALQLACKRDMASQRFFHTFPIELKTCTDKL